MKNKKLILFDLDDTLCDYQKAKNNAIQKINRYLEEKDIDWKEYWKIYNDLEGSLFDMFLEKEISKETYRIRRFLEPLKKVGFNDYSFAKYLNNIYVNTANVEIGVFSGVEEILKKLSSEYNLAIFTNGPSDGKNLKIDSLKIRPFFKSIYISEEIAYSKPSPNAFLYILEKENLKKEDVVMIGDSIKHDIKGAINSGIDYIHFDPKNTKVVSSRISSLTELEKIFK